MYAMASKPLLTLIIIMEELNSVPLTTHLSIWHPMPGTASNVMESPFAKVPEYVWPSSTPFTQIAPDPLPEIDAVTSN